MSKFKFKLQKLLDIKIKEEEESKIEYINAQNNKKIIKSKLESLEADYYRYSDITKVKDRVTQAITLKYISSVEQSIKITAEKLNEAEIKLSEAKGEFIEKQIKRKSLETLKENEISRLEKEAARIEQITNDEFALYAFIRNKANLS